MNIDITHISSTLNMMRVEVGQLKNRPKISIEDITIAVSSATGVSLDDIRSTTRKRSVVLPRQVAMAISYMTGRYSLAEVGKYFNGKNHATILHAKRTVSNLSERDKPTRALLQLVLLNCQDLELQSITLKLLQTKG